MCVNNGNMKGVGEGEHIEQRNLGQFVITLLSCSVIAVKDWTDWKWLHYPAIQIMYRGKQQNSKPSGRNRGKSNECFVSMPRLCNIQLPINFLCI